MSSMDSPHRQRPLAGVDQALGEGRARQPTELLDQLRERLSRLDANHPSAPPRPADQSGMEASDQANASSETEPAAPPDESPGQDDLQDAVADAPRQRRPEAGRDVGRDNSGQASADSAKDSGSSAEETSRGWSDDVSESSNAPDQDQAPFEANPGWGERPVFGDPYRPWFAADEPITPWFAE